MARYPDQIYSNKFNFDEGKGIQSKLDGRTMSAVFNLVFLIVFFTLVDVVMTQFHTFNYQIGIADQLISQCVF